MELQRPGGLEAYPNVWAISPAIRSPWEFFKNYGYTLEPEFALMFNQQQPLMASQHLLPIGEPDSSLEEGPDQAVPKWEEIGIQEMLDLAPQENTLASMKMFVQGVMEDGETLIKLDLNRDQFPLREDEYLLSLDIDSINWITYKLRVLNGAFCPCSTLLWCQASHMEEQPCICRSPDAPVRAR